MKFTNTDKDDIKNNLTELRSMGSTPTRSPMRHFPQAA